MVETAGGMWMACVAATTCRSKNFCFRVFALFHGGDMSVGLVPTRVRSLGKDQQHSLQLQGKTTDCCFLREVYGACVESRWRWRGCNGCAGHAHQQHIFRADPFKRAAERAVMPAFFTHSVCVMLNMVCTIWTMLPQMPRCRSWTWWQKCQRSCCVFHCMGA